MLTFALGTSPFWMHSSILSKLVPEPEAKEKESGATVHFVTAGIDEGEIILQGKVAVSEGDTPEKLAEKVHKVEYEIFPKAIKKVLEQII